jgi:hypothetical protein
MVHGLFGLAAGCQLWTHAFWLGEPGSHAHALLWRKRVRETLHGLAHGSQHLEELCLALASG